MRFKICYELLLIVDKYFCRSSCKFAYKTKTCLTFRQQIVELRKVRCCLVVLQKCVHELVEELFINKLFKFLDNGKMIVTKCFMKR